MIPYARQSIADEDVRAVNDVLRSDFLTQGAVVPAFEKAIAQYVGAPHGVATSNATAALHVAVAALDVGPGDLLWTSPNSFVASANCGLYCGADVDFVDVDPRTYSIDPIALGKKLDVADRNGKLPKVVVVVDFSGQPCDLAAIAALRDRYGFAIVEDASHAIGATYRGVRVGGTPYADVVVFSFHPVKIITTGEGGVAVTHDARLAERIALLRSHGITRDPKQMQQPQREPWEYEQIVLGYNYRLTEIQAALGIAQLARIETFLEHRRAIARRYDEELADLPLILPYRAPDVGSSLHLYPVQVADSAKIGRRELYDGLRARDIGTNVHYMPIPMQPYYRALGFNAADYPVALGYYERALSLPMYADLDERAQGRVIGALRALLQ